MRKKVKKLFVDIFEHVKMMLHEIKKISLYSYPYYINNIKYKKKEECEIGK